MFGRHYFHYNIKLAETNIGRLFCVYQRALIILIVV